VPTFRRFDEIEAARELTGAVKGSAAEVLSHAYVALEVLSRSMTLIIYSRRYLSWGV
jgi:hypothetical protein